jgi:hypothetical protein
VTPVDARVTDRLLLCGVCGALLFVAVALVEASRGPGMTPHCAL